MKSAFSPSDKRWLRKVLREEIARLREEILIEVASGAIQLGGYDGMTDAHDADDWYGRTRIGFHTPLPQRQDGDTPQ